MSERLGADRSDPKFADYAHPESIVSPSWLAAHLDEPGLVVIESDEDLLLYHSGHVPGAIQIDWFTELNDPVVRDYLDGEGFAALLSAKGVRRDDTVVLYGDKSNWWAAYAFWVFKLYGHEDVRLLDGGRARWAAEDRPLQLEEVSREATEYPVVERVDEHIRAFREDVLAALGSERLIDVRSEDEYTGARTTAPDYPEEGALRAGHIPTAHNVPWGRAVGDDGGYLGREELAQLYVDDLGIDHGDRIIAYCRIGERSSHTWFALKYLLGFEHVRNYDGSWSEWGSSVRVPIVQGRAPGEFPAKG